MGPLAGVTILEFQGIGPAPFCSMMLADMGADVIRVDRAANVPGVPPTEPPPDVLGRGRRSIGVDLKHAGGVETMLRLVEKADGLIEGFRPGVMERLGLGPNICRDRNPALVYGRMTGWGQDGPYAQMAGHDINYIALGGALAHFGPGGVPVPPLNLVGDFGGGGMLLAYGMVCGLFEAKTSGRGQVIDAAMVDGTALLMAMFAGNFHAGHHSAERGTNVLDMGSHFYNVYETSDGEYVSFGSAEPQFYAELLRLSGLGEQPDLPQQFDKTRWPEMKDRLAELVRQKTRDEWCQIMEGSDVCFAPLLTMTEAARHPHNAFRGTYVESFGVTQPAPAPRFSRSAATIAGPPTFPGQHTDDVLHSIGLSNDEVAALRSSGAVA
jgi:alpha-methylacyl-CoA racemase